MAEARRLCHFNRDAEMQSVCRSRICFRPPQGSLPDGPTTEICSVARFGFGSGGLAATLTKRRRKYAGYI